MIQKSWRLQKPLLRLLNQNCKTVYKIREKLLELWSLITIGEYRGRIKRLDKSHALLRVKSDRNQVDWQQYTKDNHKIDYGEDERAKTIFNFAVSLILLVVSSDSIASFLEVSKLTFHLPFPEFISVILFVITVVLLELSIGILRKPLMKEVRMYDDDLYAENPDYLIDEQTKQQIKYWIGTILAISLLLVIPILSYSGYHSQVSILKQQLIMNILAPESYLQEIRSLRGSYVVLFLLSLTSHYFLMFQTKRIVDGFSVLRLCSRKSRFKNIDASCEDRMVSLEADLTYAIIEFHSRYVGHVNRFGYHFLLKPIRFSPFVMQAYKKIVSG